jgi:hypothetical protein
MGFLDKLLGRSKGAAESVGNAAEDVGDKAKEGFEEAKDRVTGDERDPGVDEGGSDLSQAEQRLDNARDQALREEGRLP